MKYKYLVAVVISILLIGNSYGFAQTNSDDKKKLTGFEKKYYEAMVRVADLSYFQTDFDRHEQLFLEFEISKQQYDKLHHIVSENMKKILPELEKLVLEQASPDQTASPNSEDSEKLFQSTLRTYLLMDDMSKEVRTKFKKTLHPIQRKKLRNLSTYVTTYMILAMNKKASEDLANDGDRYLKWPEWIAEKLDFEENTVESIRNRRIKFEKKMEKELKSTKGPSLKSLLTTQPKEKLSAANKQAFANLKIFLKFQVPYYRLKVLGQLPVDKKLQKSLEISKSQLVEIQSIELTSVIRRFNGSTLQTPHKGTDQQLQSIEDLLNKSQKKELQSIVKKSVIKDATRNMHPWSEIIVKACLKDYSNRQLETAFANLRQAIENQHSSDKRRLEDGIQLILKPLPTKQKKQIQYYLGKRYSKVISSTIHPSSIAKRFSSSAFPVYKVAQPNLKENK